MDTEKETQTTVDPTEPQIDHEQGNELPTPQMGENTRTINSLEDLHKLAAEAEKKESTEVQEETETPAVEEKETETPTPGVEAQTGTETTTETETKEQKTTETKQASGDTTFTPDLSYKVRDEVKEMDEWVKPFIKDEETQKKFQDLFTRGEGLELAKQERDEAKTKLTNIESSLQHLNGYVQQFYQNPENADVGANSARQFIEALGLPRQMFLQYALQELKYQNMPPEQKAQIDAQRAQMDQLNQLQTQNQQLAQSHQQTLQAQRSFELQTAMADPTVSQMIQDYDAKVGRQGAFRELVVQRGIFHEKVNQVDIGPQQAIQEVVQMLGLSPSQGTTQAPQAGQVGAPPVQQQNATQATPGGVQAGGKKPVIPNISGQGGVSPVKRTVKSLDDIRNRYNELTGQQTL